MHYIFSTRTGTTKNLQQKLHEKYIIRYVVGERTCNVYIVHMALHKIHKSNIENSRWREIDGNQSIYLKNLFHTFSVLELCMEHGSGVMLLASHVYSIYALCLCIPSKTLLCVVVYSTEAKPTK